MCCELLRQNSQSTLLKIETPAAKKNAKPVANIFLNGANIHLNIKMFWPLRSPSIQALQKLVNNLTEIAQVGQVIISKKNIWD